MKTNCETTLGQDLSVCAILILIATVLMCLPAKGGSGYNYYIDDDFSATEIKLIQRTVAAIPPSA